MISAKVSAEVIKILCDAFGIHDSDTCIWSGVFPWELVSGVGDSSFTPKTREPKTPLYPRRVDAEYQVGEKITSGFGPVISGFGPVRRPNRPARSRNDVAFVSGNWTIPLQ